jgi:hypothetical protein
MDSDGVKHQRQIIKSKQCRFYAGQLVPDFSHSIIQDFLINVEILPHSPQISFEGKWRCRCISISVFSFGKLRLRSVSLFRSVF